MTFTESDIIIFIALVAFIGIYSFVKVSELENKIQSLKREIEYIKASYKRED